MLFSSLIFSSFWLDFLVPLSLSIFHPIFPLRLLLYLTFEVYFLTSLSRIVFSHHILIPFFSLFSYFTFCLSSHPLSEFIFSLYFSLSTFSLYLFFSLSLFSDSRFTLYFFSLLSTTIFISLTLYFFFTALTLLPLLSRFSFNPHHILSFSNFTLLCLSTFT